MKNVKTNKLKKWLPFILAVLVAFVILISIMPVYLVITQIVIIVKNPKDNILVCKSKGGEWLVGGWGEWWCRYKTNDWGKECYSDSDCSGHCLYPGGGSNTVPGAKNGYCSKYNDGADNGSGSRGGCFFEKGRDWPCIIE